MKKFYIFWFVFCAGWGFGFIIQPTEPDKFTLLKAPLTFLGSAFFSFIPLFFSLLDKKTKLDLPSLNLKPSESYPVGLVTFILVTFLFIGIWGIIFSIGSYVVLSTPILTTISVPINIISMALGAATGGYAVTQILWSRFNT